MSFLPIFIELNHLKVTHAKLLLSSTEQKRSLHLLYLRIKINFYAELKFNEF